MTERTQTQTAYTRKAHATEIQSTVTIENWFMQDGTNCLARFVVDADPIDKKLWGYVYTDDGAGNGNLILKFSID